MDHSAKLTLFSQQDVDVKERNDIEVSCRRVVRADLEAILAIENKVFDYPWSREEFEYCLRDARCEGLALEREGEILGYAFFELRQRTIRLLSCAVAESERRKGYAARLIKAIEENLTARRSEISCVVRERNVVAQLFLRSVGFRALWIARSFYSAATEEDAYKMIYQPEEALLFDRSEIEVPLPFAA